MVRTKITTVGGVVAGAAGVLLLAACGGGTTPVAQPVPSTTTVPASPTSTTPAPPSTVPATSSPSQPPPDDGLCKAGDVSLALRGGDGAAGTVYRSLVITNSSDHPCTIQGFPGVSYVAGADGHQVGPAAFREGAKGEPIKLAKGESASTDVGFVQVRNFDPAACKPTDVTGLRIYLPQETAPNFVRQAGTGCAGDKIPGNQLTVKTLHKA